MKRLFLGLIIAAAGASAAGCRDQNASAATPPTPPTVSVVTVAPERVAVAGEWIATLDGNVNAQIRPQVTGYLTRRAYREGAFVRKGELLFEIDRRPLEAALSQARARLAEARAQLAKSERDLERDRPLAEQRAIAQSQLDNDLSARDTAQAAQASAEAAVESAELNLRFTRDHLADRRHRRHRQRPDRRPGRADDAAHDRVAGGPDQGLLPDQRAGVPRHRRRRPLARRARPALAGRRRPGAGARRRQHLSAARHRRRRRSRGRPEDGHDSPQRHVPEPRQRAAAWPVRPRAGADRRRGAGAAGAAAGRVRAAERPSGPRRQGRRDRRRPRRADGPPCRPALDRDVGAAGRRPRDRRRTGPAIGHQGPSPAPRRSNPTRPARRRDVALLHRPADRRHRHRHRHRARRRSSRSPGCRSRSSRRSCRRRST